MAYIYHCIIVISIEEIRAIGNLVIVLLESINASSL